MAKRTMGTRKKLNTAVTFEEDTLYRRDADGVLQPIPTQIINTEYDENVDVDWDKIWLGTVMEALEQVGNKKMKVASYILNKRDKNTNFVISTQREIAEACGVSLQTVSSTLKALEEADLIVGKSGVYQVNPDRIARGKHNKRMAILRIYNQNKDSKHNIEK